MRLSKGEHKTGIRGSGWRRSSRCTRLTPEPRTAAETWHPTPPTAPLLPPRGDRKRRNKWLKASVTDDASTVIVRHVQRGRPARS